MHKNKTRRVGAYHLLLVQNVDIDACYSCQNLSMNSFNFHAHALKIHKRMVTGLQMIKKHDIISMSRDQLKQKSMELKIDAIGKESDGIIKCLLEIY